MYIFVNTVVTNEQPVKRIHFIAIGGAAMHNLAIALKNKAFEITGSDDEIFEPSLSRLRSHGLLPSRWGWDPTRINDSIDAIILGMHAQKDNPELLRAMELGIKIYSYPEFLYEQTKDKIRVVIAGSHGKTTITAMVIHVLKTCKIKFDFMVGSQIEGFDTMVSLTNDSKFAVFEGDEYLSSPLDPRPKFLHYYPHIALISGIAWDHINVFPTYDKYVEQFKQFIRIIPPGGHLVYYADDLELQSIAESAKDTIEKHTYREHFHEVLHEVTYLKISENQRIKLQVFGGHNLQNISGAKTVCKLAGVSDIQFYKAIAEFPGTAKRLQVLKKTADSVVFMDFAHSPSKVRATVSAVKKQFPFRTLVAILELHTYSSLNKKFIPEYSGTLSSADKAVVYFNSEVIKNKGLEKLNENYIKNYFNYKELEVFSNRDELEKFIMNIDRNNVVILLMSSGNFGGLNLKGLFL
jgi:UDP-N-acetylmuramate: L-alanyl-gamma-D-glutamyl-meso-diaminopimelate ligase